MKLICFSKNNSVFLFCMLAIYDSFQTVFWLCFSFQFLLVNVVFVFLLTSINSLLSVYYYVVGGDVSGSIFLEPLRNFF